MTMADWITLSLRASASSRLVSAVLCFVIFGFLRPENPNYPNVKRATRWAAVVAGVVLAFNGVDLLYRRLDDPPRPLISGYALSIVFLWASSAILVEVMGSWMPAVLRKRIDTFRALPTCVRRAHARRAKTRASLVEDHPPIRDGLDDVLSDSLITRMQDAG